MLSNLNERQLAVVQARGLNSLEAAPGTGKTKIGRKWLEYGIEQGYCQDFETLALTFTNRAVQEFKERGEGSSLIRVSTFHSYAKSVVEMAKGERVSLLDPEKRRLLLLNLVQEQLKKVKPLKTIKTNPNQVWSNPALLTEGVGRAISTLKAARGVKENYQIQRLPGIALSNEGWTLLEKVYPIYQKTLEQEFLLDMDDLVPEATRILKTTPKLVRLPQIRVKRAVVDELQDLEQAKLEMVVALFKACESQLEYKPELLAVGDPYQQVYGLKNTFQTLGRLLPLTQSLKELEVQHRYGPTVNRVANHLAWELGRDTQVKCARNKDDDDQESYSAFLQQKSTLKKPGRAEWAKGEIPVTVYQAQDEAEEAKFIAEEIFAINGAIPHTTVGILLRTRRQAKLIDEALRKRGLPPSSSPFLPHSAVSSQITDQIVEEAEEHEKLVGNTGNTGNVKIMTIPEAKGMAFSVVFIPGMVAGIFPVMPSKLYEDLMWLHVAVTRSQGMIYLTYSQFLQKEGKQVEVAVSPYLRSLEEKKII